MTPDENRALSQRERDAGLTVLTSSPSTLTIESTSICNLRCVMCPHAIDGVNRPKHMPADLIARLEGPMRHATDIQLHGIGEPLASPAFWRALESGSISPGCIVNVNTNLTLLNDRRLKLLVESQADLRLNVSMDAATATTYARIRGAEFDEILTNIRRLVAARAGRARPMIYVNMTLMRANIEEAPDFVDLAHALGVDGVCLWQMNRWPEAVMDKYQITRSGWHFDYAEQGLWNFPELSNATLRDVQQRAAALGLPLHLEGFKDVFFDVVPADPVPPPVAPPPPPVPAAEPPPVAVPVAAEPKRVETVRDCQAPWNWALISTNGHVRPCCFASDSIGDLNEASFEEIWNGADAQQLRRDMLAGIVHRVCRGASCKFVQNTTDAAPQTVPKGFGRRMRRNIRKIARPVWHTIPLQHRLRLLELIGITPRG